MTEELRPRPILVQEKVAQRLSNKVYLDRYQCPNCNQDRLARAVDVKKHFSCKKCGNESKVKHGYRRKKNTHPLYVKWEHMKQRCYDPNHSSYCDYGGRGIKVCDEWQTFQGFMSWALIPMWQPGTQIDRIDVNGDYTPSNCRWATVQENSQNRRSNVLNADIVRRMLALYDTGRFTQRAISELFGCSQATVSNVLNRRSWSNV